MRRGLGWLIAALAACVLYLLPYPALAYVDRGTESGVARALLIGVEHFADAADAYPAASRNVGLLRDALADGLMAEANVLLPPTPPADADALHSLLRTSFAESREEDLCLFYLCSHGRLSEDGTPVLLLSDGHTDSTVTPEQLERAFDGVHGHILLILDTCYSGGFIGKGMNALPEKLWFRDGRFSVLTSCGGCEKSWYYLDGIRQGAFYFTELLTQGLSAASGTPCDLMRDGAISLSDLYRYLSGLSGTSHPQCYPQQEDVPLLLYDASRPLPDGPERDAVMSPSFRNSWLSDSKPFGVSFTVARPARVAYQLVPWRGVWDFAQADLYYDTAESEGAPLEYRGYLTPGRKSRSLTMDVTAMRRSGGYLLFQLLSVNAEEHLRVHASRVLCVPAAEPEAYLEKQPPTLSLQTTPGGECQLTVRYPIPCVLTCYLSDVNGSTVQTLCLQEAGFPLTAVGGEVFYTDTWPQEAVLAVCEMDFGGVTRVASVNRQDAAQGSF